MNTDVVRVVKALAGIIVLVVLLSVVMGWLGDYRDATPEGGSETTATATSSAEPTKTSEGETETSEADKGKTVVVLIEGLNMREKPAADGKRIRGLKKGDRLTLLKQADSWYQVRAADKKVGWISANPQYTKIEEQ